MLALGLVTSCTKSDPGSNGTATPTAPAVPETDASRRLTRAARLLAGIDDPRAAKNDPLRASDDFRAHAGQMSGLWAEHNATTASRISPWVQRALQPVKDARTLFYPFAGADVLYANAFFPGVHTSVLVGLERVGTFRDLDGLAPHEVAREYERVQKAITPLLQATYFRTMEMQSDVLHDGVLTMLATLLAGTRHRIVAAETMAIARDGHVVSRPAPTPAHGEHADPSLIPGARIDFTDEGSTTVRTLYYFRADLSNKGLARHRGLLTFVDTLPSKVTFTKAASYLMQQGSSFSTIREYVLAKSAAVLQDDTGVGLRAFDRATWDVQLFGSYTAPIPMFKNYRQPDLAAAYASGEHVGPLPFHVGYGHEQASNLLLAVRRRAGAASE